MPPVGWEKMNPVQLALSNASAELSLLHGLVIKHMPYRTEANLKVIKLVHKAEEWLKTHDCEEKYQKCEK